MTDELITRGQLSQALVDALHRSTQGLRAIPELLSSAIEQHAWEERVIMETGEVFGGFASFDAWVNAPPPKGLGASPAIIDGFTRDNEVLRNKVDGVRQRPAGNPNFGKTEPATPIVYIIHNREEDAIEDERPSGTSADASLRRLRKDRPDLHAQVLAGELSPHRAAVIAGHRHDTITVPKDDVDAIARRLRSNLTPDQLDALIQRLSDPTE